MYGRSVYRSSPYLRKSAWMAALWSRGQREATAPWEVVLAPLCGRQIGDRLDQAAAQLR